MSLNLRSIAVAGIGFGALAVASQGLITPAQEQWDTAQGAVKHAAVFKPSQDAEARFIEQVVSCSYTVPQPYAEAYPNILGETGYASHHNAFAIKANGFATIKGSSGFSRFSSVLPLADCSSPTVGVSGRSVVAQVYPVGEAMGYASYVQFGEAKSGESYPWGVQNPTDEELILLVRAVRRARPSRNVVDTLTS